MKNLFNKNYRKEEVDSILELVNLNEKVAVLYLNDVGKNPFIKLLVLKLQQSFPKNVIFNFDCFNKLDEENFLVEFGAFLVSKFSLNMDISKNISITEIEDILENIEGKSQQIIINIQFNYILGKGSSNEMMLGILNKLRKYNPVKIIPIIHAYWTHELQEQISKSDYQELFLNTIFQGPFTKEAFPDAISYLEKKTSSKFTDKEIDTLYRLSGGIPKLYKFVYLYCVKNKLDLNSEDLVYVLLEEPTIRNYLQQLMEDIGVDFTVQSEILDEYLSGHAKSVESEKQNEIAIVLDGKLNYELFTSTESRIIHLIQKTRGITSREDVAKLLWGDDFVDSYSDYAIDRHISNIRKKLKANKLGEIKSMKGRGFILDLTTSQEKP